MSNKSRRREKKILSKKKTTFIIKVGTVATAVILTILLGVLIPRSINKNSSIIEMTKEYEPGEDVIISLKKNEEIENLIDDDAPKDIIIINKQEVSEEEIISVEPVSEVDDEQQKLMGTDKINTEAFKNDEITVNNKKGISNAEIVVEEPIIENGTEANNEEILDEVVEEEATDETQYVKDEWVDDMIHENEESIDSNDLAAGAAIYNKLDTTYLFGLAEDGMTEEEKAEAMVYLETNLSEEEYILAKVLFDKYIGLTN